MRVQSPQRERKGSGHVPRCHVARAWQARGQQRYADVNAQAERWRALMRLAAQPARTSGARRRGRTASEVAEEREKRYSSAAATLIARHLRVSFALSRPSYPCAWRASACQWNAKAHRQCVPVHV
jgi:hypothetical protein